MENKRRDPKENDEILDRDIQFVIKKRSKLVFKLVGLENAAVRW
jgi:hypothetical protein